MNENLNKSTNSELKEMLEELSNDFENVKRSVILGMLKMEKLEEKYKQVSEILKKRNIKND